MASEDTITFCQTNFSTAFACLDEMRKTGDFCDLAIQVSNVSVRAHRVILAARIPYFRSLFSDGKAERTDIPLLDLDPTMLESVINFAYSGTISISVENVLSLLKVSQIFLLEEVSDACVEFLSKRLLLSNVLEVHNLANGLNKSNLIESCVRFIQENFEEFSRTDDFRSLTGSVIKEIISVENLNVTNEKVVIEAVLNWVRYSPPERHTMLPELLREVRMIYLPIDYLIARISSDELVRESLDCRNLIDEAKNYHLKKNDSECLNLKREPRKYSIQPAIYAVYRASLLEYYICQYGFVDDTWRRITSWTCKQTKYKDRISSVVGVNGKLYMFFREIILTFHPKTLEWQELEARHSAVDGAAVVPHENIIYFFGSYDVDFDRAVRRFDTEQNKWLKDANMKTGKCNAAAATLGGFIYVTGGYGGGKYLTTVEKYNPLTGEWSEVAPLLTPRRRHSCVSINEKIYVFGGSSYDHDLQTGEMYDPVTNSWSFVSSMRIKRSVFSLVCHKNEIYALGGLTQYPERTKEVEIYDAETDKWRSGVTVPLGPWYAVSIPIMPDA